MYLRLLFACFLSIGIANAKTMSAIDVYSQEERRIPIAIVTPGGSDFGVLGSISKIVNEDLNSTARFVSIEKNVNELPTPELVSEFISNLRSAKFDNVVTMSILQGANPNQYIIKMNLYDSFSETTLVEKKYVISSTGVRKVAHIIGDVIMLSLVGYEGDFNTKLIYVDEVSISSSGRGAYKKISVVDRDGYNQRYLTTNGMAMSPTYSPARKSIFYSDFTGGVPKLNMINVVNGKIEDLSKTYPSLAAHKLISPSITQDGNNLAFTILHEQNANIYNLDFSTGQFTKLTTTGLNVSSCFSPDGNHIAYTSNISGKPAIFIMSSNGWNAHRITFERGHYMEPEWSPNSEWIAFTKLANNVFSIGIIRPDGKDERILYSGFLAEGPTWSPSSQQIAFSFREKGETKTKIKIIDLKGRELKILETPGKASDVTWVKID